MPTLDPATSLVKVYPLLRERYGHQGWWPGETPLEICVGAILTQNTNWRNVEKAIANLKQRNVLNFHTLVALELSELAQLIRPAGYYNLKAQRVKSFLDLTADRFEGHIEKLFELETAPLRELLLSINGIGPETADSILLYAAQKPSFVIDAYTKRILTRHGWALPSDNYDSLKQLCETHLTKVPTSGLIDYWQDYHAQLVQVAKEFCLARSPRCQGCPLEPLLESRALPPESRPNSQPQQGPHPGRTSNHPRTGKP